MKVILYVTAVCLVREVFGRGTWNANGQYEYYVSPGGDSRPYDEAQAYCNGQGGELALVKTQQIQEFIQTLVTDNSGIPYGFFIGLRDIGSNGTFIWNDGEGLSYTNWAVGEPNDIGSEFCVIIGWIYTYDANLPWYNTQCTTGTNGPRGFVCQRSIDTKSVVDTSTATSLIIITSSSIQTSTSNDNVTQSVTTEDEFMKSTLSRAGTCSCSATQALSCSNGFSFEPVSFIIGLIIPTIIFVAVFVKFYLSHRKLLRILQLLPQRLSNSKHSQPPQEIRHYENVTGNFAAGQSSSQEAQQGQYESISNKPEPTYVNRPKSLQEPDYLVPMEPHYIEPATVKVQEAKYEEFQK